MNLLIHAGPHKTGTTSLQNFLRSNKLPGLLYPLFPDNFDGHHYLAAIITACKDGLSNYQPAIDASALIADQFKNAADPVNTIVFASEYFIMAPPAIIHEFSHILSGALGVNLCTRMYFNSRPIKPWIISCYKEFATAGTEVASFSQYVEGLKLSQEIHWPRLLKSLGKFGISPTIELLSSHSCRFLEDAGFSANASLYQYHKYFNKSVSLPAACAFQAFLSASLMYNLKTNPVNQLNLPWILETTRNSYLARESPYRDNISKDDNNALECFAGEYIAEHESILIPYLTEGGIEFLKSNHKLSILPRELFSENVTSELSRLYIESILHWQYSHFNSLL